MNNQNLLNYTYPFFLSLQVHANLHLHVHVHVYTFIRTIGKNLMHLNTKIRSLHAHYDEYITMYEQGRVIHVPSSVMLPVGGK